MKKFVLLALSLVSLNSYAGVITVIGNPTQIEITDRLFFKIDGGVPKNPYNCSSNFKYEFVMEDGTSGENKNMALSVLLSAQAMGKKLKFTIFSTKCSDIHYPAVIGLSFE